MVRSRAATVKDYLTELPATRRAAITAVRKVILANLPPGYVERMNWGMISYEVPLARCPRTYNGQPLCYAALASQKNYCTVHLMNVYGDPASGRAFREAFEREGRKLDMGKACVRFLHADDLSLDAIGRAVAATPIERYIEIHEQSRQR